MSTRADLLLEKENIIWYCEHFSSYSFVMNNFNINIDCPKDD